MTGHRFFTSFLQLDELTEQQHHYVADVTDEHGTDETDQERLKTDPFEHGKVRSEPDAALAVPSKYLAPHTSPMARTAALHWSALNKPKAALSTTIVSPILRTMAISTKPATNIGTSCPSRSAMGKETAIINEATAKPGIMCMRRGRPCSPDSPRFCPVVVLNKMSSPLNEQRRARVKRVT